MYVINLNGKQSKEHIAFYYLLTTVYFDSYGIEYIPQDEVSKTEDTPITHKIYRKSSDDSIMCEFCCIAFIEYMIAEKTGPEYTNLFSPYDYQKNDKRIYKYFKDKYS